MYLCFLDFSTKLQESGELCTQEKCLAVVGTPRIERRDATICFSYF